MAEILLGVGLVLLIEGLVLAFFSERVEDLLAMLRQIPVEYRRFFGLGAALCGVTFIWAAKGIGL